LSFPGEENTCAAGCKVGGIFVGSKTRIANIILTAFGYAMLDMKVGADNG